MSEPDITKLARHHAAKKPIDVRTEKSEIGLELKLERGTDRARLTMTLDGDPLSSLTLSAAELRLLSERCLSMARSLDEISSNDDEGGR